MSEVTLGGSAETTLGVMGGGQLGRMFVQAAQQMGFFTAVLDADPLSPAGRVSHHHIQTAYTDADGLHTLAVDIANQVRGPLSIGCLLTFAQILLPELRRKFELKFPDVRIRQYERNQGQLLDMLHSGEIDLALTYDL